MKRNRLLFLLLFLLSLTFVYFYGGRIPYMFFYTVLILPVISMLYTLLTVLRFRYSQKVYKKFLMKGDTVNFIFSISNEDLMLYPYIKVTFSGADTIFKDQFQSRSFSIAPFGKKNYSFELLCKYRGSYQIGIQSIEIEDFLGLFKIKYKVPEPKFITVYPKVTHLNYFQLYSDHLSESRSILRSSLEDQSSIDGIREYAHGDSLKKIHWKLTAKTGKLMVKKYQSTSETSAVVFLDLHANNFSFEQNTMIEDKVIEAAGSVLEYCVRNWIPVKLVYYDSGLKEIEARNPLMFEELYNILATVQFKGTVELKDLLDFFLKDNVNKTNIVLFTSNINYGLYNVIYNAKTAGYNMHLIHISPKEAVLQKYHEDENIIPSLPEIGVNTYQLMLSDDIKSRLENRSCIVGGNVS